MSANGHEALPHVSQWSMACLSKPVYSPNIIKLPPVCMDHCWQLRSIPHPYCQPKTTRAVIHWTTLHIQSSVVQLTMLLALVRCCTQWHYVNRHDSRSFAPMLYKSLRILKLTLDMHLVLLTLNVVWARITENNFIQIPLVIIIKDRWSTIAQLTVDSNAFHQVFLIHIWHQISKDVKYTLNFRNRSFI